MSKEKKEETENIGFLDAFKFDEFKTAEADYNETLKLELNANDASGDTVSSNEDPGDVEAILEEQRKKLKKTSKKEEKELEEDEDDSEESKVESKTDGKEDADADEEDESGISYKSLVDHFVEKGILGSYKEEDFEETEESFEKVFEENIEERVEQGINQYKESLPEVLSDLVKFIEDGGNIGTYLQVKTNQNILDSYDVESEDNQEKVVRQYLKIQGDTDEEIDESIETYKDSLILKKEADKALKKLRTIAEKDEQRIIAEQEAARVEAQKQHETYIASIKETIKKAKDIGGLPITEKEKRDFEDYLLKVGKDGKTSYTKELEQDPINGAMTLAYFKFKKFDFSTLEKKVETKVTKNLKEKIFKGSTNIPKGAIKGTPVDEETMSTFRLAFNNQ